MRHRFLLSAALAAFALAVTPAAVRAQTQLPDGPGKAEVQKLCSTCHPADRGASVRLTRDGWQDVMTRMVGLGMKGTDEELNVVLEYMATHFKGEAAAPLNLNRATPVQLQSIAGLLRKRVGGADRASDQGPVQDAGRSEGGRRPRLREDREAARPAGLLLTPADRVCCCVQPGPGRPATVEG